MKKFILALFITTSSLQAKDLGTVGATFKIHEKSLLEVIQEKLNRFQLEGKLESFQKDIQERIKDKVLHPPRIASIKKTEEPRSYLYDPSMTVEEDIKDHKGRLIHKRGTKVNPLDFYSWGEPLLFLDGEDQEQINWAHNSYRDAKWVLIAGNPIELSKVLGRQIYFDQGGLITKKLHIRQVPCIVTQQGKHLLIQEITLTERGNKK